MALITDLESLGLAWLQLGKQYLQLFKLEARLFRLSFIPFVLSLVIGVMLALSLWLSFNGLILYLSYLVFGHWLYALLIVFMLNFTLLAGCIFTGYCLLNKMRFKRIRTQLKRQYD